MELGPETIWLTGEKVRPWVCEITFNHNSFPQRLVYKYSLVTSQNVIWEREPSRYLEILAPSSYTGDNTWLNQDKGFIVNSMIEKQDANFVGSMTFDQIADTGISIG